MYDFIDVTEISEGTYLPSEALSINGEYIENQIQGYRTLYVSGREALSPELISHETGVRDGSVLRHKRFPARTITVGYQLIAENARAFRTAYNALASILNVDNAELIFYDETDKFYIGTPSLIREVEPGRNAVVGEFEIFCADPFKYSVTEYEATSGLTENSIKVDYNGTYKAYPKITAEFYKENEAVDGTTNTLTGNGDCGYVAFYNEREKIIQLGSVEEVDGLEVPRSQTLICQSFDTSAGWGTAAKNQWALNNGVPFEESITEQVGAVGFNSTEKYLNATDYGSSSLLWHGPTITRSLPADAAGVVGATNWCLDFNARVSIGEGACNNQEGGMRAIVSDADGNVIAGVYIYKSIVGKEGTIRTVLNNKLTEKWQVDMSYNSKQFGVNGLKYVRIQKNGNRIKFIIGGYRQTYFCDEIADAVATKVTFLFFKTSKNYPALAYNGLYSAKFVKNNWSGWEDFPNRFSSNDVAEVDCRSAEITLNNVSAPELGALGNDWENFYLVPGLNQIGYSYSDWVEDDYAPTIKVKYREVFL